MIKKLSIFITTLVITLSLTFPAQAVQLINPLGGTADNPDGTLDPRVIIGGIIQGVLGIIGSIALIIFIYGGALMVFSLGDFDKVKRGRDAMIWAGIGLVVVFSSYALTKYALDIATKAAT